MVRQASRKYGVDESLILQLCRLNLPLTRMRSAVPMRWVNAGGTTYCRERCVPLAGETGTPSRSFLFDPASNIDTGTRIWRC